MARREAEDVTERIHVAALLFEQHWWLPVGSQTGIPDLALSTITTARGEDVHS
jgi:hypothetical protein